MSNYGKKKSVADDLPHFLVDLECIEKDDKVRKSNLQQTN